MGKTGRPRTGETHACAVCGASFYVPGWKIRAGKGQYCSLACGRAGRTYRPPTASEAERFWPKVEKTDGCWVWTAAKSHGYGNFRRSGDPAQPKAVIPAHVWAWESVHGPVPADRELDHICHNGTGCRGGVTCPHRACVRLDHLELVDRGTNIRRGEAGAVNSERGQVTHCHNGHAFDEANTRVRPDGARLCRRCDADRAKAYRERVRAG